MSHFAQIENDIVVNVIVASPEIASQLDGKWIQTSFNTRKGIHYEPQSDTPSQDQSKALRKNFAGIGDTYDKQRDAFIPQKPAEFPSFVLDEFSCTWVPPVPKPAGHFVWNEPEQKWVEYAPNELDLNGKPNDLS